MYLRSIFLLAIAAACPAADTAEQLHPSTVTRAVRKELYQRDLIEWSDELARQLDEADVRALMTALDVFIRAGQPERISRAIEKLRARKPGRLHAGGFWAERLLKLQYYTQARQWFDSVEPNICTRDLMKAFIRNWEATGDLDELEAWLKTKADRDNPVGRNCPGTLTPWRNGSAGIRLGVSRSSSILPPDVTWTESSPHSTG